MTHQSPTTGEASMFLTLKTLLHGIGVAGDMADVYAERMVHGLSGSANTERRRQLIDACVEVDLVSVPLENMKMAGHA